MKQRLTALLLAGLLLLTGCGQKAESIKNGEYDLGTIPDNISTGDGWWAMVDNFIYSAEYGYTSIVEYDVLSGKATEIELPKKPAPTAGATSYTRAKSFYSSIFLLNQSVAYVLGTSVDYQVPDEEKMVWTCRDLCNLVIQDLTTGECAKVSELGDNVFKVIPVKKTQSEAEQLPTSSSEPDNPLAGLELYYYFGYDTFPEMASQLKEDGIMLEEPIDPNERNRYVVDALGYMDGDTRQTKVLTKDFVGCFNVDNQYIYVLRPENNDAYYKLYRSRRDNIDFQELVDVGNVGNCVVPYDDGFYFYRLPGKQICFYKDGQITELPIAGSAFKIWRDQIIFLDNAIASESGYYPVKKYDRNTGEIKTLCEGSAFDFHILGDKYLGYIRYGDESRPHILVDLETGEQVEIPVPST